MSFLGGGMQERGSCRVRFSSGRPELTFAPHTNLSRVLTVENSGVLFGCRTGLCGTCASLVTVIGGAIPPPDEEELETLELACESEPRARLLCRLDLTGDILIEPLPGAPAADGAAADGERR